MEIYERIQEVRNELHLSRRAFGEKLGVTESVIVNIEYDRLKRPDQKEPLYRLICETFGISENWLRTGQGEMFKHLSRDNEIAVFLGKTLHSESDTFQKRFISMLARLSEEEWALLEKMATDIAKEK